MITLGLDISTKTGWAIVNDGRLVSHGLITAPNPKLENVAEDFNMVLRAHEVVAQILSKIAETRPDKIVIEQTNQGSFRSSQKQLEFLHCLLLWLVDRDQWPRMKYVNTSEWRSNIGLALSKEQRDHNKNVKKKKAKGKITPKHLSVAWANKTYGLKLKLKDNDIADAIALASFKQKDGKVLPMDKAYEKAFGLL